MGPFIFSGLLEVIYGDRFGFLNYVRKFDHLSRLKMMQKHLPPSSRHLLELSFEPTSDGFLYYRTRWSPGIPVSAAEREAYLQIPAFGSRHAWRKSLSGRPRFPPRAYGPVARKLLFRMPAGMAIAAMGVSSILGIYGFSNENLFLKYTSILFSIIFLIFSISILIIKYDESSNR